MWGKDLRCSFKNNRTKSPSNTSLRSLLLHCKMFGQVSVFYIQYFSNKKAQEICQNDKSFLDFSTYWQIFSNVWTSSFTVTSINWTVMKRTFKMCQVGRPIWPNHEYHHHCLFPVNQNKKEPFFGRTGRDVDTLWILFATLPSPCSIFLDELPFFLPCCC